MNVKQQRRKIQRKIRYINLRILKLNCLMVFTWMTPERIQAIHEEHGNLTLQKNVLLLESFRLKAG